MVMRRREFLALLGGSIAAYPSRTGAQQAFPIPGKPVRIIVPFPPGGTTDVQARVIGQRLAESLGVPVIVENKAGGSTLIGTREVQKAAPDGHTLLYTIPTIVQLPHLFQKAPWDVFADFTPITTGARASTVLTAHSSMPFNTVPELVAYAKANPGKLSYASFGTGTSSHLNGEWLQRRAGIELLHVPYKGSGEAMKDHLSGTVQLFFDGPTTAISNAATGQVKLIATAAETRLTALPTLPTLREQGYEVGVWGYLWFWGPAGVAPATVDAVYQHLAKAINGPDIRDVFAKGGAEATALPPSEMAREARRLLELWQGLIREFGVRLDP
jgi:tripartite-type tricarboxylate transporter receptor subunit TctC